MKKPSVSLIPKLNSCKKYQVQFRKKLIAFNCFFVTCIGKKFEKDGTPICKVKSENNILKNRENSNWNYSVCLFNFSDNCFQRAIIYCTI